jgi:hypothetical protein
MARRLRWPLAMKQASWLASTIAVMAISAGCKVDMNSLTKRPGRASAGDTSDDASGGGGGGQSSGGGGATSVVAVKSDLCTADPDADYDVQQAQQDRADRTTICEMVTIEPAPGVERIAAQKPGWCDKLSKDSLAKAMTSLATQPMKRLANFEYWWDSTPPILASLCASPDDPMVQEQTGYFYQWWVNETGVSPAQLDGFFRYFAEPPGESTDLYETSVATACKALPAASDEASERDRRLNAATRQAVGCGQNAGVPFWVDRGLITDVSWDIDAAAEPPSELVRAYLVLSCLVPRETLEDSDLAAYAVCGADARALDPKAMETQIASYPELVKAQARMLLGVAQRVGATYEAAAQAKASADPAWQTMLYDAPAGAWKQWASLYQANKAPIDAARAYETAFYGPSRKAAKGCWKSAWGNFTAHVQAAKASSLLEAKHAMTDTVGAIILEHLVACTAAEGETVMNNDFSQLYGTAPSARGPRYASVAAVIQAINTIQEDRSKFSGGGTWFNGMFTMRSPLAEGSGDVNALDLARDDQGGVVKKVKKDGDVVRVEFKSDRWKEPSMSCVQTDRIQQIGIDGTLIYEQKCTYGKDIWVEQTHDPISVPAALAGGIKPGSFVRAAADAFPVEVWANKDRKVLTAYMGVEL